MEENYRQDNMSVKKVWVKSFSASSNFSESEDGWTVVKYSIIIMTFNQVVSIQLIASCGHFFRNHTNYFIAVLFYPKVWLCLHPYIAWYLQTPGIQQCHCIITAFLASLFKWTGGPENVPVASWETLFLKSWASVISHKGRAMSLYTM